MPAMTITAKPLHGGSWGENNSTFRVSRSKAARGGAKEDQVNAGYKEMCVRAEGLAKVRHLIRDMKMSCDCV